MKASRRNFLATGLGTTLVSCAKQPSEQPADNAVPAQMQLLDFQPRLKFLAVK